MNIASRQNPTNYNLSNRGHFHAIPVVIQKEKFAGRMRESFSGAGAKPAYFSGSHEIRDTFTYNNARSNIQPAIEGKPAKQFTFGSGPLRNRTSLTILRHIENDDASHGLPLSLPTREDLLFQATRRASENTFPEDSPVDSALAQSEDAVLDQIGESLNLGETHLPEMLIQEGATILLQQYLRTNFPSEFDANSPTDLREQIRGMLIHKQIEAVPTNDRTSNAPQIMIKMTPTGQQELRQAG